VQVTIVNKEFDFSELRAIASQIALVGSLAAVSTHAGDLYLFHIEALPAVDELMEKRIVELARERYASFVEISEMYGISNRVVQDVLAKHNVRLPRGRRS